MDVLPKFELSDFQDVADVNDFIKKMHAYVIVRLHLEGMAGNKEAWKIMAKLHVDRALTRSKIQAVLAGAENRKGLPPGTKAVQIEGDPSRSRVSSTPSSSPARCSPRSSRKAATSSTPK